MRTAIIGGGIAGLAAAYELEKARAAGADEQYTLFEAQERLGGFLASEVVNGAVLEYGPDSFLSEKPAAAELCRELGLAEQLTPSNDAERKTYVVVRNRLVPLPDGLMFLVPTKLIPTALYTALQPADKNPHGSGTVTSAATERTGRIGSGIGRAAFWRRSSGPACRPAAVGNIWRRCDAAKCSHGAATLVEMETSTAPLPAACSRRIVKCARVEAQKKSAPARPVPRRLQTTARRRPRSSSPHCGEECSNWSTHWKRGWSRAGCDGPHRDLARKNSMRLEGHLARIAGSI